MASDIKKVTKLFYLQQFTSNCIVIYPFYAIMFSERSGLSTAEISALFGWWILVALLSELPTGTLADKFSRRSVIILSNVMQATAFAMWLIMPSFIGYGIGFLLWGIGFALNSGAFQACVYDELKSHGQAHIFTKVLGRITSMRLVGMLVAFLIATLIGPNYPIALVVSILISLSSSYVAFLFPKAPKIPPEQRQKISQISLLKDAIIEVSRSKLLIRLVITLSIAIAISSVMAEYVPLYDKMVGVPVPFIPLILTVDLAIGAALSWIAHRFESRTRLFGLLCLVLAGAALLITSYGDTITAVLGMFVFMELVELSSLLYQSSLQHHISGASRATIGSLPTFIAEALSVAIVATYGIVSRYFGDFASIRMMAAMTLLAGVILFWFWKNHQLKIAAPAQLQNDII